MADVLLVDGGWLLMHEPWMNSNKGVGLQSGLCLALI